MTRSPLTRRLSALEARLTPQDDDQADLPWFMEVLDHLADAGAFPADWKDRPDETLTFSALASALDHPNAPEACKRPTINPPPTIHLANGKTT